jgi:hypothetical protein
MLEMHRRLSDIIFNAVRGSHGGILKVTSLFRQLKSNVGERKINSLASIAGRAACRSRLILIARRPDNLSLHPKGHLLK